MGKSRKTVKKSIRLINNKTIRTTKKIKNHTKIHFRKKANRKKGFNSILLKNIRSSYDANRERQVRRQENESNKVRQIINNGYAQGKRKLNLRGMIVIDIIIILLIFTMFFFVKCVRDKFSSDGVDYKHLDISGTWYKVNLDEMTKVSFSDDGKYEEQNLLGEKIASGTYKIGEHSIQFNKKTLSMNYVDEEKELKDIIEDDDISEYELRKYFYTDEKENERVFYFSKEEDAADKIEDNLSLNRYYEKSGMFDENGFAIDGEGVLLAYKGDAEEITIPENVTRIAENAMSADYERALKTKKVIIPANVKKIDSGAFSFSTVDIVVIEDGVGEIENWAFGDSEIKEIYFPEYIATLHEGILDTEEGLEGLKIHCKAGSQVEQYFKNNPPDGIYEISSDMRYK